MHRTTILHGSGEHFFEEGCASSPSGGIHLGIDRPGEGRARRDDAMASTVRRRRTLRDS